MRNATIGGTLLTVLIIGVWVIRAYRVVNRISGSTVVDATYRIEADDSYGEGVDVEGEVSYDFEVTATDRPVYMVFGKVKNPDAPSKAEVLRMVSEGRVVPAGSSQRMSGRIRTGRYLWGVVNLESAATRAKVKFKGY